MTEGIVLTPDYAHMFRIMLREAVNQSDAQTLFDFLDVAQQAQCLRAVQRFLAPLNIACQCMTNREAVEQFRETLNAIVQDIDRTAGVREEEDDRRTSCREPRAVSCTEEQYARWLRDKQDERYD